MTTLVRPNKQQIAALLERLISFLRRQEELYEDAPDEFVALLQEARKEYADVTAAHPKGGKRLREFFHDSLRRAWRFGYHGNVREWEDLIRAVTKPAVDDGRRHPWS